MDRGTWLATVKELDMTERLHFHFLSLPSWPYGTSLVARTAKNLPAAQETQVRSLGRGDTLGKGMATDSSVLAWRIPRTEEPGGLQSTWSQRRRHD